MILQYLLFTALKLNHFDLHHIFKRLIAILIMMGVNNNGHVRGRDRGRDRDRDCGRGHDYGRGNGHDRGHDDDHFND